MTQKAFDLKNAVPGETFRILGRQCEGQFVTWDVPSAERYNELIAAAQRSERELWLRPRVEYILIPRTYPPLGNPNYQARFSDTFAGWDLTGYTAFSNHMSRYEGDNIV